MKAFTLLQCLTALLMISLLASMGLPSYQYLQEKYRSELAKQQLLRALYLARAEAIYRHQVIKLAPIKTWGEGYQVLMADTVLRQFKKPDGHLSWQGFPKQDYLAFTPAGFTQYQNGTFRYRSKDEKFQWRIIVNQAGRARIER